MDCVSPPEDNLITYGPEVVEDCRNKYEILRKKEDRENAIVIIRDWLQKQDHLVKKDYSNGYIERCIFVCKGSLLLTKLKMDRICTFRTLKPQYFQTTNLKESDIMTLFNRLYFTLVPRLTKEFYRVVIIKIKPGAKFTAFDYTQFYKLLACTIEYMMENEYSQGHVLLFDMCDANFIDVVSNINFFELQQFIPIVTKGYGVQIKGIYFITASKMLEGFINLVKPLFSEKIGARIHAARSRSALISLIGDVLPEEYGGLEKPVEQLHDDLIKVFSAEPVQKLLTEINKAVTDESKRTKETFYEQYMGMPGSFRHLSVD